MYFHKASSPTILMTSDKPKKIPLKKKPSKDHSTQAAVPPPAIFRFSPESGGFDHIGAYNQFNSPAFSFVTTPPLRVKTYPPYHRQPRNSPPGISLTLPSDVTIIRSTGKLQQVQKIGAFPDFETGEGDQISNGRIEEVGSPSESPLSDAPVFEHRGGPRNPPAPTDLIQHEHPNITPGLFSDPFAEYMQDRLARFRPSEGQSNPNAPLDFAHPYQVNEDVPVSGSWTGWLSNKWQSVSAGPNKNAFLSPIVESSPQLNSSSLFLPRGTTLTITNEPRSASIDHTPQADALDSLKSGEVENIEGGRSRSPWYSCC